MKVVHLSESVLIALHSLILIARQAPRPVTTKQLAGITGASENTISKVMQRLVKEKFISSNRGPAGGFILIQAPSEISLLAIYEAIEGSMEDGGCPFNRQTCIFDSCIFGSSLQEATRNVRDFFMQKTFADYL